MKRSYILSLFLLVSLFLTGCDELDEFIQTPTKADDTSIEVDLKASESVDQAHLLVHYIDANQADASLFQFEHENKLYNILYDTGDWKRKDVIEYLKSAGIKELDLVIISHPHADHIGQLSEIRDLFTVKEVWMNGSSASTQNYLSAMEKILAKEIAYLEPRAGEVFDIGPVTLTVLHPKVLNGDLNKDSLSILLEYKDVSFGFTGDAYKLEERLILKRFKDLDIDVLQLGHHGSNTSTDPLFLDSVKPEIAIYSAGLNNKYGHPHKETLDLLKERQIQTYGTATDGTILIKTDGHALSVEVTEKKLSQIDEEDKTSDCIDLNTATKEALTEISHIGPERAEEIIRNRPYQSLNQLKKIKGIGKGRLDDIIKEERACVGDTK